MKDYLSPSHPESLVDRLRGKYLGSAIPSGTYKTSPLHHEAADEIERLRCQLAAISAPDESCLTVSANALRDILQAFLGPQHLINELRVIHDLDKLGLATNPSPVAVLISDYNAWAARINAAHPSKETPHASTTTSPHAEEPGN